MDKIIFDISDDCNVIDCSDEEVINSKSFDDDSFDLE